MLKRISDIKVARTALGLVVVLAMLAGILSSCIIGPSEGEVMATRAAVTIQAIAAGQTAVAAVLTATAIAAAQRSPTPIIKPATPTALPTMPMLLPSLTPFPTYTSLPYQYPTYPPSVAERAYFVRDETVPDGTRFNPGQAFNKAWRLRNGGTTTWTTDYMALFFSGDILGAPSTVRVPVNVFPGQEVVIAVDMAAPVTPGRYQGNWKLRNAQGVVFGLGDTATGAFTVIIDVSIPTATVWALTATPTTTRTALTVIPPTTQTVAPPPTFTATTPPTAIPPTRTPTIPPATVTGVNATGFSYAAPVTCGTAFMANAQGTITVSGATTVTYQWIFSDGSVVPGSSAVVFPGAATSPVSITNKSFASAVKDQVYWVKLQALSPNSVLSTQVEFTMNCN